MKKLLSLLLCLALLAGVPTACAEKDAALSDTYPTAPIPAEEYCRLFDDFLAEYSPGLEPKWYFMATENGVVLTNQLEMDGVQLLQLTVQGGMVTGVTVSVPYYTEDVQLTAHMWTIWSVLAAVPFARYDGMAVQDAEDRCGSDFNTLMSRTNMYTVCPVYGMQAEVSRENGVMRMQYTLHGQAPQQPSCTVGGTALPGFTAYSQALESHAAPALEGGVVWTTPEDWNGATLIAVDNLGDTPALALLGDEILVLMLQIPYDAKEPQEAASYCMALSDVMVFVPLLMAQGMTAEEADAEVADWYTGSGYRMGLLDAMNGTPYHTVFSGANVEICLRGEGENAMLSVYLSAPVPTAVP